MTAIILIGSMALFLLTNVPIAVSLGLACFAAIIFGDATIPMTMIPQRFFTGIDSFPYMAVPFFMLAGTLMETGSISRRLIDLAKILVGWMPGGLGIITVLASAFFGALSGSNAATVAAIGAIMIPAMVNEKYPRDYAAALTASAGTLGVVIPPSVPMVTYGVVSGTSIGALFMAGFIPGLIMVISMSIVVIWLSKRYGIPKSEVNYKELGSAIIGAIPALLMPLIILGGIYGGVFTATEAAAVSVLYAFIVSVFIFKEIKFSDLPGIFISSGKSTAMVLFIIATSSAFSWFLTSERIPDAIANAVLSISNNPIVILLLINLLLLILGIFLETNAIILLVTPIMLPIIMQLGVDPVLFGVIMVINTSVGMITPPMAMNIMVASGVSGVSIEAISKKIIPFLLILVIDILVITFVPAISLTLPKIFGLM